MTISFRKMQWPESVVAGGLIVSVVTFAVTDLIRDYQSMPHVDNVFVSLINSGSTSTTSVTQIVTPTRPWPDLSYLSAVALQPVDPAIAASLLPRATALRPAMAKGNKRGTVVASRWASLARRLVRRT